MKPRQFRYIPHTADAGFIANGRSFEQALENAALALLNLMLDVKKVEKLDAPERSVLISEKAGSDVDIVWYVLQDILSMIDARKLNATRFKIETLERDDKSVVLKGRLFYKASKEDCALMSVKAVTPHALEVKHDDVAWKIRVVVDV